MVKAGFYYTGKDLVVAHAKVMIHSAPPHIAQTVRLEMKKSAAASMASSSVRHSV